jgi:hypothetical protein
MPATPQSTSTGAPRYKGNAEVLAPGIASRFAASHPDIVSNAKKDTFNQNIGNVSASSKSGRMPSNAINGTKQVNPPASSGNTVALGGAALTPTSGPLDNIIIKSSVFMSFLLK